MESRIQDVPNYPAPFIETTEEVRESHGPNLVILAPSREDVEVVKVNQSSWDVFTKRALDLTVASFALILFALPMIVIAIAIKLTSRGSIFYGQERVTLNGKKFLMLKFRSMKEGSETNGAVWAIKDDPRRTKLGAFLRASSLDELPQLWNVIRGDMAVVGPRPERPIFVDMFQEEISNYNKRHLMKSGITGWAQICGWRGNTSIEKRVQYDLFYIKHWSIWFDIKILCLTLIRGFINKNAY